MHMNLVERIHSDYVHNRRTNVLSDAFAGLMPQNGCVLDVGCGDGLVSRKIQDKRPDVAFEGVDVLIRPKVYIPVRHFDGVHLPYADSSFDATLIVDVLHHINDPELLIREAARVSRKLLLVKDHRRDGFLADPTLRFMDWVGNERHGVSSPANYWPEARWRETFAKFNLTVDYWTDDVPLYPHWASWLFGRSLHFIASVSKRDS
jgi:SAM-dependent methyltransferase